MLLYETNDFLVMFLVPPLPGRAPVAFRQLRASARGLRGKELGRGGDRPQEVAAAPCQGRGGEGRRGITIATQLVERLSVLPRRLRNNPFRLRHIL